MVVYRKFNAEFENGVKTEENLLRSIENGSFMWKNVVNTKFEITPKQLRFQKIFKGYFLLLLRCRIDLY